MENLFGFIGKRRKDGLRDGEKQDEEIIDDTIRIPGAIVPASHDIRSPLVKRSATVCLQAPQQRRKIEIRRCEAHISRHIVEQGNHATNVIPPHQNLLPQQHIHISFAVNKPVHYDAKCRDVQESFSKMRKFHNTAGVESSITNGGM